VPYVLREMADPDSPWRSVATRHEGMFRDPETRTPFYYMTIEFYGGALSATATVTLGGSLSALGHFDVGDQYTYAAGGESRHGGEERACFRCGHRRTDGSVIRIVQVDRAVSRRRTPIFFRPDLRRLEPEISRYSPSGLQLLRLIGGFEGVRVGGVVIDDRDLGFGQWISLTSLVAVMTLPR
jgi:hypothetical protein